MKYIQFDEKRLRRYNMLCMGMPISMLWHAARKSKGMHEAAAGNVRSGGRRSFARKKGPIIHAGFDRGKQPPG